MLVKSPTNAGMDAVFRPLSSLGTDGSQFAGSLLAALRRVGSTALACEAVAGWVGHSRVYGSALLVPEPPRLKTLVHHVGPWLVLPVGSVQPLATPAMRYDVAAASGGNSLFGILSL
jgi:hypothetical protein